LKKFENGILLVTLRDFKNGQVKFAMQHSAESKFYRYVAPNFFLFILLG
jgi:hypothetical protein